MEKIFAVLNLIRPQDLIDILLLSAVIYWLLTLIKGTRTIPILLGLSVLLGVYVLATFLRLDAIGWLMGNLFSSVVVILVVLFQADIRNALARVGLTTMFREARETDWGTMIFEVARAAEMLSAKRIGGTIVLELETGLRNYIERGAPINGSLSSELLVSIFHPASPLHDGAVIITKKGEVAAARCILPLSTSPTASLSLGTRHRSGLGLSEETDSVVILVSEERGTISLAHQGRLYRDLEENDLKARLRTMIFGNELNDEASETEPKSQPAGG